MIPKIITALILTLASSGATTLAQEHKEPMAHHRFDHPEKDAALAMAAGDLSLRGVNRFATIVPGISGDYTKLTTKYTVITIENTTDVVIVNDPKSYNNMAERYAFAYNRYIFDRLGCDYRSPLDKCTNYP